MAVLSLRSSPSRWWQPFGYTAVKTESSDTATENAPKSPSRLPSISLLCASRRVRAICAALIILISLAVISRIPLANFTPAQRVSSEAEGSPVPEGVMVQEDSQELDSWSEQKGSPKQQSTPEKNVPHGGVLDDHLLANLDIDWTQFAYVQYVTNRAYLCNSVMMFESLNRLGSRPDRVMMYPSSFNPEQGDSIEGKLLRKARDDYKVKLRPIQVQHRDGGDSTWSDSFTKLLALNQTDYSRVLGLDSDSTILKTMDELFLLPSTPVAMPRAYWLPRSERRDYLSSQLVLVEPSVFEFQRVEKAIRQAGKNDYDMEIMNQIYGDSALILPHRRFDLLTGEFRGKNHAKYLGNEHEKWDAQIIFDHAKFLHFSDWPLPKPWLASAQQVEEAKPPCGTGSASSQEVDCVSQRIWMDIYASFRQRRKDICGTGV